MTIVNDVNTVATLRVGEIVLIVTPQPNGRPAAQACTVEAVYRDEPGWIVEYRYTVATLAGEDVQDGWAYYHHGDDLIDVISMREEEQPAASEEPVTQTTSERIAEGISEPCATCGAAAGDYCSDECIWVVVGYGDPNT